MTLLADEGGRKFAKSGWRALRMHQARQPIGLMGGARRTICDQKENHVVRVFVLVIPSTLRPKGHNTV